jgi:hypothetical protein
LNFPGNLGASFSSAGAYPPPRLNMGAYQQRPIGSGGSTFNQESPAGGIQQPYAMPAMEYGVPGSATYGTTGLQNVGPAQTQTYDDYLTSIGNLAVVPQTREQFETEQNQIQKMRSQGMDMLGRGNMGEIMAGLGGQPGQMPLSDMSGLTGLLGGMRQPQQQTSSIAQQYMNPYLQNVLTPQMEELRRQAQINNLSGLGALTKSGAFGGGRQAIMESEAGRNLLQEQNKTIGAGYSNAFDRAMSQFNTEQARDLGLAKFMSDQGTTQRGIEAEGIAADKAAFEAARENPYKMVQYQQSLLQGMPISATNIDMATPSKLQEILSGIGGGIKMVGNNPSNVSLKDVTDLLGNLGLKTGG